MSLDSLLDSPPLAEGPEPPGDGPTVRTCAREGCTNTFEVNPRGFGAKRLYCDEHAKKAGPKKDRAPRSARTVKITMAPRPNRAAADQAKMEERVKGLLTTIAGLVQFLGEAEDAADIRRGRDTLAAATAQLAEYEPWLKKILSGGKASDRVMAWVAFVMALLTVAIPIADRHGLIPAQLKELVSGLTPPTPDMAQSGGDHDGEQPVAA